MKLITENANKQKEIDSGKLQKKLEKEHLAKKCEETMEKAKVEKIDVNLEQKQKPKPEPEPEPEQEPEKKKKIKKIVCKEVSDDDEVVEEVIIKRKPKIRPQSEITPLPPFGLHGVQGTEWWPLNPCLYQHGYRTSSRREPKDPVPSQKDDPAVSATRRQTWIALASMGLTSPRPLGMETTPALRDWLSR